MKIDKKELNKHQLELTVRISKADAQPYLNRTAAHLSEHHPIKGFRPGKAPYEIVKKEFGEDVILKEAMEEIINETFSQAVESEKLNTYGKVGFELLPALDPQNIVSYKAIVTLMPTATLGDWKSKKIKPQEVKVTDLELNKALEEMANMTTKEEPVLREAKMGDKAVIDFEVYVDGKLIEGGSAKDFGLILGEGRMIPGFEEQIVGKKAGDKLEFDLNFPENYQSADLNGKPAHFKINVNQIQERITPELNDDLAKRVGLTDIKQLKEVMTENILKEKQEKEQERVEIESIKQVTESTKFTEIPQILIEDTIEDLVHDFEHAIAHRGMKLDQYLKSIGKTLDQIKKDYEPKALERIKSSMALGKLAEDEKLTVTPDEIDEVIKAQKQAHASNPQAMNDLNQPEYRRHVANSIINRKIINHIKEHIVE